MTASLRSNELTRQAPEVYPHPCYRYDPATCQINANDGFTSTFQATSHSRTHSRLNILYAQGIFEQEEFNVAQSSSRPFFSSQTWSFPLQILIISQPPLCLSYVRFHTQNWPLVYFQRCWKHILNTSRVLRTRDKSVVIMQLQTCNCCCKIISIDSQHKLFCKTELRHLVHCSFH